jgi:glutamate dehydrogenase
MPTPKEETTNERLAAVVAMVRDKVAPAERDAVEAFVLRCYEEADPDDFPSAEVADLYGGALSLWNLARRRVPGEPRVRVLNPTIGEHGWQSPHTIVEIVNDDMPFLVDRGDGSEPAGARAALDRPSDRPGSPRRRKRRPRARADRTWQRGR